MLRIIHFSDTHYDNPVLNIPEAFNQTIDTISKVPDLDSVDVLVHSGDWFDDVVHVNTVDYLDIQSGSIRVLKLCAKHDITLVVLEGTGTHDYHQSRMLLALAKELGVTIKYIEDIELFSLKGYTWLAVPDSLPGGYAASELRVRQLMDEQGVTTVHFGITHGMYDYQLPAGMLKTIDHHKTKFYCAITEYIVMNGHNHTPSVCEKINNTGGLFRTRHGEEHDKGLTEINLDGNDLRMTRHINEGAIIFHTHTLVATTEKEALDELVEAINNYDGLSSAYLRIVFDATLVINYIVDELRGRYPLLRVKAEPFKEKKKEAVDTIGSIKKIITTPINERTITDLVTAKLDKMNVSSSQAILETFNNLILGSK